MKTRNLLILSGICLALIMGAAAWQLSSGNLFGSDVRHTDTTVADAPDETIAATASPTVTMVSTEPEIAATDMTTAWSLPSATVAAVALTVRGNGIGAFNFGADADTVIGAFTVKLGTATADSGWKPQPTPCDEMGVNNRSVTWGWVTLTFSSGPTRYAPGNTNHMMALSVDDPGDGSAAPDLRAGDDKALLGATLAELQARFPGTEAFDSEITGPSFALPDGLGGGLRSPDPVDPASTSNPVDPASTSNPASTVDPAGTVSSLRAGNVCID